MRWTLHNIVLQCASSSHYEEVSPPLSAVKFLQFHDAGSATTANQIRLQEIAEDIKEIREDIQEYRASVRKAVAAKLHITTGDNKDEESIIHLDEEELKTVKSVVETIKDAPPIGVNSWRVGSNVFSIARVGYSALKSLRFLNEHGEEIVSFAIGDDDDEADKKKQSPVHSVPTVDTGDK